MKLSPISKKIIVSYALLLLALALVFPVMNFVWFLVDLGWRDSLWVPLLAIFVVFLVSSPLWVKWFKADRHSAYRKAIVVIAVILNIYFYLRASSWESALGENWMASPQLSNLSASLEYTKALVRIVMVDGVVALLLLSPRQK